MQENHLNMKLAALKKLLILKLIHFREFPKYLNKLDKKKPVAMFCTGGIRCEKASVYLNQKGFKNVFQLKGGILNYLKKINKKDSLWKGECFVFDNRVSVKHDLSVGTTLFVVAVEIQFPKKIKNPKSTKKVFLVLDAMTHSLTHKKVDLE